MLFIGCKKLDIKPNNLGQQTTNISSNYPKNGNNYYWVNVEGQVTENRLNPFDSVGYNHNIALQEIESKCTQEMSYSEVMNVAINHLIAKYKDKLTIENPDVFLSKTADSVTNAFKEDEEYNYVEDLNLSEIEKVEIKKLLNIILKYEVNNYTDIIISIKSFEKDLLNKYNENDIRDVLFATSIARYSLAYWHNRMDSNNKSWKKWIIGACDVIGGVAGGVAGSSTVVGAAAGAIVGAGATSTAAAKMWKIFAEKENDQKFFHYLYRFPQPNL